MSAFDPRERDLVKCEDMRIHAERALRFLGARSLEEYRKSKQKRLKMFRLEAVRTGFKKAWQEHDYTTTIAMTRKIPDNILQEDPKLLMWYNQAAIRTGGN